MEDDTYKSVIPNSAVVTLQTFDHSNSNNAEISITSDQEVHVTQNEITAIAKPDLKRSRSNTGTSFLFPSGILPPQCNS